MQWEQASIPDGGATRGEFERGLNQAGSHAPRSVDFRGVVRESFVLQPAVCSLPQLIGISGR
jgi:hypothetical protein